MWRWTVSSERSHSAWKAWLTIAAEDAPELIGTAPVAIDRIRYYKALAACVPVLALLLPLALYRLYTNESWALKPQFKAIGRVAASSSTANHNVTVVPRPSWLCTSMLPPCKLMSSLTRHMPKPVPGILPDGSAL
jgi:hypothetical protein